MIFLWLCFFKLIEKVLSIYGMWDGRLGRRLLPERKCKLPFS